MEDVWRDFAWRQALESDAIDALRTLTQQVLRRSISFVAFNVLERGQQSFQLSPLVTRLLPD